MNRKPSALPLTMSPNNQVAPGLWSTNPKPIEKTCEREVMFYPCDNTATYYENVTMGNGFNIKFYYCDDHATRHMIALTPQTCAECGETTDTPKNHDCPETAQADG